jgi:hypothetical protein
MRRSIFFSSGISALLLLPSCTHFPESIATERAFKKGLPRGVEAGLHGPSLESC